MGGNRTASSHATATRKVARGSRAAGALNEARQMYFAETGGMGDCPIYDRYQLGEGDSIEGPAIIDVIDSTAVIHPGARATVDRYGSLILRR